MYVLITMLAISAIFLWFSGPAKCPKCGGENTSEDFDVDIMGHVYNECNFCHNCEKRF